MAGESQIIAQGFGGPHSGKSIARSSQGFKEGRASEGQNRRTISMHPVASGGSVFNDLV
jgi:hypothetical protein